MPGVIHAVPGVLLMVVMGHIGVVLMLAVPGLLHVVHGVFVHR